MATYFFLINWMVIYISLTISLSNRFQSIFLDSQLGSALTKEAEKVDNPDTMDEIAEKMMNVIEYVNGDEGSNGHGFTVMGWYKRGTMKDAVTANNDTGKAPSERTTIDSGKMQLHVSMIKLTDEDDMEYIENGEDGESMHFNVQTLHGAIS